MNVEDNVAFAPAAAPRAPGGQIRNVVRKTAMVGLSNIQGLMPSERRGMRSASAPSHASEPEILLYDEPTTA